MEKKKSCFFCNEPEHSSDSEEDFSKDVLVNPKKTKGRRIDAVRRWNFRNLSLRVYHIHTHTTSMQWM